MQEFSSVTASSYDADALAPLLNEKSAEGWSVVAIVSAGSNIVAYLEREASEDAFAADTADAAAAVIETTEPVAEPAADDVADEPSIGETSAPTIAEVATAVAAADTAADTAAPVDEPAGWASAPESAADTAVDTAVAETEPVIAATEPAIAAAEPVAPAAAEPAAAEPAAATTAATETPAAQPESTVPAGWYADPSGRFELRYWDGTAWTEHVSRAGQQFTDPPVA